MTNAQGEVGKPLLYSLLAVWLVTIALYFAIDPLLDAHIKQSRTDFPSAPFGPFIHTLNPATPIIYAVFLSVLFFLHWGLSGLFGKPGAARKPIANVLLIAAGLAALLEIFEHGALDFYDYSLFCLPEEPTTVILVDEVYRCERSLMARKTAQWSMVLLPILAIPVRIFESRLGEKNA